jgi:hypothetical protein
MPIQILDNFEVNVAKPIDNRFVVGSQSFYTNKEQIPYRYPGLRIWDLNDNFPYIWTGVTWSNENQSGTVIGSGTNGRLPKFFGSSPTSNVVDSQIFDNGINVGINISSPTDKLHVSGNIRTTGFFIGNGSQLTSLNATNITSGNLDLARITSGTSGQILVRGTSNAEFVNSNTITVGTSNVANNLVVNTVSDTSTYNLLFSNASGLPSSKTIFTNSSSIRIQASTGNVGIGTSPSSTNRLTVSGTVSITGNVGIGGNPQSYRLYVNGGASIGTTTAPPSNGLRVNGDVELSNNLRVNGNIIIGNLNLTYSRLSITNGGVDSRDGFYINLGFGGSPSNWRSPETTKGGLAFFYQTSTLVPPDSQNKFIMYTNVPPTSTGGLVTLKEVFKFSPVDPRVQFDYGLSIPNEPQTAGAGRKFALRGDNGEIRWSSFNAQTSASDLNLKKNIIPISSSTFKDILNLNPVNFEWIDNNGMLNKGVNIGLIAQDVQKYYPDAVNKDEESGTLSINPLSMISILIGQIKNQNEEILKLTKRIEDLES